MDIRYVFEHKRLPMYCFRNRDILLALIKKGKLEEMLEFLHGQAAEMIEQAPVKTKIKIINGRLKSGEVYFVVDRTEPTKALECKWLVGIIGEKSVRYFACELAIISPEKAETTEITKEFIQNELKRRRGPEEEKYYVLCEWTVDHMHRNLGSVKGKSYDSVIDKIERIVAKS